MWDSTAMGFTRSKVEQHPIEMSVSIVLEALNSLDEVNFAFEVQFLLVASWKDERINTVCNGAGASGHPIPATDRCAHYWTPQLPPVFPNQVSIDGNMAIEVLEDLGLFTVPGRYRKECNSPEGDCSSPINTSMAYRMMRLRGSFGAEMEFRRFPFDRQALEFIIRAPANMPRTFASDRCAANAPGATHAHASASVLSALLHWQIILHKAHMHMHMRMHMPHAHTHVCYCNVWEQTLRGTDEPTKESLSHLGRLDRVRSG